MKSKLWLRAQLRRANRPLRPINHQNQRAQLSFLFTRRSKFQSSFQCLTNCASPRHALHRFRNIREQNGLKSSSWMIAPLTRLRKAFGRFPELFICAMRQILVSLPRAIAGQRRHALNISSS